MYCRKAERSMTEIGYSHLGCRRCCTDAEAVAGIACHGETGTGLHTANKVDEPRFRSRLHPPPDKSPRRAT